jgi:hypothetical protein
MNRCQPYQSPVFLWTPYPQDPVSEALVTSVSGHTKAANWRYCKAKIGLDRYSHPRKAKGPGDTHRGRSADRVLPIHLR